GEENVPVSSPCFEDAAIFAMLPRDLKPLPAPYPAFALFLSVSDGKERAQVVGATGNTLAEAWEQGRAALSEVMDRTGLQGRWLRVDWIDGIRQSNWAELRAILSRTKRNYFRCGLALDPELKFAFTEQELNANAMLYGGNRIVHAIVNEKNFARYARLKFGPLLQPCFDDGGEVHIFTTCGLFRDEHGGMHMLNPAGLDGGRRRMDRLTAEDVLGLIAESSAYLARQVLPDGRFVYG